jgi:hypothetical protein
MLEALATVILAGLMLVPVLNIFVGLIAGFVLGGLGGALLASFIHEAVRSELMVGDEAVGLA